MQRFYPARNTTFAEILSELDNEKIICLRIHENSHFPFLLYFLKEGHKILDANNGILLFSKEKRRKSNGIS